MAAAKWKLFIDDTGAAAAGTYVEVTAAINANQNLAVKTITSPVCAGDTYETEEPEVLQASVPAQIKLIKGNATELRLQTAFVAGSQVGVLVCSGDINAAGALGGGHRTLEMNALVKQFNVTQQTGSTIVYDVVFVPHAENENSSLPEIATSADN